MSLLIEADRIKAWEDWMRQNEADCSFDRNELRAAIDAADQWVSDNQASYNAVLPSGFGTSANAAQKARLLTLIITRRFLNGVI